MVSCHRLRYGHPAVTSHEYRDASREQWSSAAEHWAAEAERRERGPAGKAADWMLAATNLQKGHRVLELACGAGDVGLRAAEVVGPAGRVLCSDFAEPMVELVRARAGELGLDQVEARVLDAEALEILEERFDAVLCRFGIMLMPAPSKALKGSYNALDPGGRLALAVWGNAEDNPWLSLLTDAVMKELGAPPPAPGTPSPFALHHHSLLRELLEGPGFNQIVIEDLEDRRRYDSAEEWWSGTQEASGPLGAVLSHLTEQQVTSIRDEALAGAAAYVDATGALSFPARVVVASAGRQA